MRNPLTAALAAMAIHTGVALVLGWPFPSVATFLAGALAVPCAVSRPPAPATAVGGAAGFVFLLPEVLPPALLVAGVAALVTARGPRAEDPLRNVAIALPALTFLTLCFTL